MLVEVLLFGPLAERAGVDGLTLEIPEGSTVSSAVERLGSDHPEWAISLKNVAVAVNEAYATEDAPLSGGDCMALIPPISGG